MPLQILILYDHIGRECSAVQSAQGLKQRSKGLEGKQLLTLNQSLIFFAVNKTKMQEQLVVHVSTAMQTESKRKPEKPFTPPCNGEW